MNMQVGIIELPLDQVGYPQQAPFDPDKTYPELRLPVLASSSNPVYGAFRDLLYCLGYDRQLFGTAAWNPLGWLIQPGQTVFIKPNMIAHKHSHNADWDYVITHGAVIRAVIDYVYIALQGNGKIIVGDAPQTDSKFDLIVKEMGLPEIKALYRNEKQFDIDVVDLRHEHWIERDGIYVDSVPLSGDPQGVVAVDLAEDSLLSEMDGHGKRYYGAYYDVADTNRHHRDGKHEYCISRSTLAADVFISVPKLKTHKKCGLTANLKGLVGINGNKNWLPHYTFGSPETGGDQFDRQTSLHELEDSLVVRTKTLLLRRNRAMQYLARRCKRLGYKFFGTNERVVRSGNWHGNDTVWRMSLDLNRILLYANPDGTMRSSGQPKRYWSVMDGIHAMEGNGPVSGIRRKAGVLIGGTNPVAVDAVCAMLIGFDYRKLPLLARSFEAHKFPLVTATFDAIACESNVAKFQGKPVNWNFDNMLHFFPHFAWKGHVELPRPQ